MKDRIEAAVMGAFIADALSLGAHWVYNTNVIDKKFGRVDDYHAPLTSYHKGKNAGEQTHYGDQMLVLLESVAASGGFDLDDFAVRWRRLFASYTGYFDHATKDTLEHLSAGMGVESCGSASDDLAGASRIAPLVAAFSKDAEKMAAAARRQTAFTHNHPEVLDAAELFARTTAAVLGGETPLQAVDGVVKRFFKGRPVASLVTDGLDSRTMETRRAIADFGQACGLEAALPGTLHLIARYQEDFEGALVENIMAGGDSSARGMPAAMILGAYHGTAAIPGRWVDGLVLNKRIAQIMAQR